MRAHLTDMMEIEVAKYKAQQQADVKSYQRDIDFLKQKLSLSTDNPTRPDIISS